MKATHLGRSGKLHGHPIGPWRVRVDVDGKYAGTCEFDNEPDANQFVARVNRTGHSLWNGQP